MNKQQQEIKTQGKTGGRHLFQKRQPVKNDQKEAQQALEITGTQVDQKVFEPSEITTVEAAQEAQARVQAAIEKATETGEPQIIHNQNPVPSGEIPRDEKGEYQLDPGGGKHYRDEEPQPVESAKDKLSVTVKIDASEAVEQVKQAARDAKLSLVLQVKKLDPDAKLPTVAHPGEDLGYDLYSIENTILSPQSTKVVRTGIVAFQEGHGLIFKDRSSMAQKGIHVVGGVIDAGYRGELVVVLHSARYDSYAIRKGDKIAQAVPIPVLTGAVEEVEELPTASRGDNGFGSSGR